MADQDTSPVADSKEWWQMQAERYKAEVEKVTQDARAATGKHAEAIAAKDAELADARADVAKALEIAQQSDAAHAETRGTLGAHQDALGQLLSTLGPAFSIAAKLLQR